MVTRVLLVLMLAAAPACGTVVKATVHPVTGEVLGVLADSCPPPGRGVGGGLDEEKRPGSMGAPA